MERSRFCRATFVSLAMLLTIADLAWSQTQQPPSINNLPLPNPFGAYAPSQQTIRANPQPMPALPATTCKIYSLGDLADAQLGEWIAETIPQVIQPGTWKNQGSQGTLSYFAPGRVMAISHTPAVHAQVEEFLKNVKKAVPQENAAAPPAKAGAGSSVRNVRAAKDNVVRAQYSQGSAKADPFGQPNAYLIPAPLEQPKHLFHLVFRFEGNAADASLTELAKKLAGGGSDEAKDEAAKGAPMNQLLWHVIMRYEGDGIIDANVVEFMKVMVDAIKAQKEPSESGPAVSGPTAKVLRTGARIAESANVAPLEIWGAQRQMRETDPERAVTNGYPEPREFQGNR